MAGDSGTWRLGHRPALDGLRGVAVLLVVASHLGVPGTWLRALGPSGVVVFFTLSGFLITALLLEERERAGRIAFGAFYLRRARRLFPAMLAVVTATAIVGVLVAGVVDYRLVVGALTYSSNWVQATGVGADSLLTHTWSLAIEEQFYLVWPVALLALASLSKRARLAVLAVAVTVTGMLPFFLWSEGWARIYYGSDTRAMPLLLGCLLAVTLHRTRNRAAPAWLAAASLAGAVAVTALAGQRATLLAVPQLVAVLSAAAIWAAATRDGGPMTVGWLRLVGARSYGLYLWHWPIFVLLDHWGAGRLTLALVGIPAAWLVTLASWRYVEAPFLATRGSSLEAADDAARLAAGVDARGGVDSAPVVAGEQADDGSESRGGRFLVDVAVARVGEQVGHLRRR